MEGKQGQREENREEKKGVILYRPSSTETTLFIIVALFSGLFYLAILEKTGNVYTAITKFLIGALVGYIAMIAFNTTITTFIASTIAKLKIDQTIAIVKHACGKELTPQEATKLIEKVENELRRPKGKQEKEAGESKQENL